MASGSVRCALEQAMTRIEEAALTYSRPQVCLALVIEGEWEREGGNQPNIYIFSFIGFGVTIKAKISSG